MTLRMQRGPADNLLKSREPTYRCRICVPTRTLHVSYAKLLDGGASTDLRLIEILPDLNLG